MKANELMIGDWVQGNPCGQHCDRDNNIYYKIAILDIGNHCWGYSVCGALVELKYDDVFPIPITPEILEKNGFSDNYCNDDLCYAQSCGDVIGIHIYGKNGLMDEMYFKYVHQLQHALRLCGIEKTIEL